MPRALGSYEKGYFPITEAMHNDNLAVLRRPEFDVVVEQFGIPVSQHDLATLTATNWLNDHIIGTQRLLETGPFYRIGMD